MPKTTIKTTVHVPTVTRLVRQLMEPLGHKRANCPRNGGWAVTATAWDMKPVAFIHWAHTGTEADGTPSNMVEGRVRSEEIKAIGEMLQAKGYRLSGFHEGQNFFHVIPEGV